MELAVFWHRRDLRTDDNAGLYYALKNNLSVLPLFIFDTNILNRLEDKFDARVTFIYNHVLELKECYEKLGSSLLILIGQPLNCFKQLLQNYRIKAVYTNTDYEPYAKQRDATIQDFLAENGIMFIQKKDQVIFEKSEILKDNGSPYTVFTPYSKKWKSKLNSFYLKPYPTQKYFNHLYKTTPFKTPLLKEIGFNKSSIQIYKPNISNELINNYHLTRNYPAINGTSKVSVYLRFGILSIRKLTSQALKLNQNYLNELIWRDFFAMILFHYPQVVSQAFKPAYNQLQWLNNEEYFNAWCVGKTGYPIVDAGMRELNETGFMHNRARMITASFLVKHLLIDWRWGEAYFAKKLLDFDLASNNGGWQWTAGTGCDAAPYFRIFNPTEQTKKFDPQLTYIKKWIPELNTPNYPTPIIDHKIARNRALKFYSQINRQHRNELPL